MLDDTFVDVAEVIMGLDRLFQFITEDGSTVSVAVRGNNNQTRQRLVRAQASFQSHVIFLDRNSMVQAARDTHRRRKLKCDDQVVQAASHQCRGVGKRQEPIAAQSHGSMSSVILTCQMKVPPSKTHQMSKASDEVKKTPAQGPRAANVRPIS